MPYDLIVCYVLLAAWTIVFIQGVRTKNLKPTLIFGLVLAVGLNVRYFIEGPPAAIAFFVGIYDAFDNVGLDQGEGANALATCADNACSVWGDEYTTHSSWGVAFYDRFVNASSLRTNLLYAHIGANTLSLLGMHYLLWRPGTGKNRKRHRLLGRITFGILTFGTISALALASEHGAVVDYGGMMAELGFYSMSAVVWGTALAAVLNARRGNIAAHRTWSIRAIGAMWGAFWLFRIMLVVTGPLLRNFNTASILISIWFSAPLGVLLAEYVRTRWMTQPKQSPTPSAPSATAAA